jgi:ribonuclease HI
MEIKKEVEIYTDGACSGNPGPGGYAAILSCGGHKKEVWGGRRRTTNNRMEILAVIEALACLKKPCKVRVFSDSKYLVDAMEKGWVTRWRSKGWMRGKDAPALNVDLWQRLLALLAVHEVRFAWVKGHGDNPQNQRCDELARGAIQAGGLGEDEGYHG